MTEVFGIRLLSEEKFHEVRDNLINLLPDIHRQKVARYKRLKDMQRSLLGEVMTRAMIARKLKNPPEKVEINFTEKGKPFMQGSDILFFNLSHSGEWVVIATSTSEVGIDVEQIREANVKIAKRFFTPEEYTSIEFLTGEERHERFFSIWTAKESYLKYLGKGLTKSLSSFSLRSVGDRIELAGDGHSAGHVFFHQYKLPGNHVVTVCSEENSFSKDIFVMKVTELTKLIR